MAIASSLAAETHEVKLERDVAAKMRDGGAGLLPEESRERQQDIDGDKVLRFDGDGQREHRRRAQVTCASRD